ncbi:ATP-binding cassette, subfamily B [Butyrivibrio sp. ob235]|uniref:ABC transporter ATP-binding protein n=1 Tax=Butyrivibrio sp. ob235 TaxID=1761780 RepID=UPI0008AFB4D5|nr:ABC transporter ATP-binding protein [Butyrivibrio sp. ob235]SEM33114.1 ATP-binding cassette, subfamily B [Butyrivibrio sp. ob235]
MQLTQDSDSNRFEERYRKYKDKPLVALISFYSGYYHNFVLSVFFYTIKHSPVWIMPIVTANIINYVTRGAEDAGRLIIFNASIVAILLILNIPMNYLHMHFRASAVRKVEAGLRSALVHKVQTMSILSEKDIQSGRIQSKIIRDVEAIETLSDQIFVNFMNIIINVVVALIVTVSKSRVVFIFFLLMVPMAAILVYIFKKPIKVHNQRFRKEVEATSAKVSEMIELVPVTRAHALEEDEISRMDEQMYQIAAEGYQLDMVQTNFGAVSWAFFQMFQVICLVFTSFLALSGKIPAGDVVLYQSYFTTIVGQVTSMLNLLPTISKGLESVSSVGEILSVEDIEDNEGKISIDDLKGNYRFSHVRYAYPGDEKNVINDLDFEVHRGETVAFVGESGGGKSTILNLIIGFMMPVDGMIYVDGIPLNEINLRSYRRFLAVVPQNTALFSGSIRDNILYGTTDVSEEVLDRVIKESGLQEVIKKLPNGMDTFVGEHGDRLSGGQKQRISIARALIRDPKVIILDEATSALDAISEREVSGALDNMSDSRTTFIVAHKLATIRKADKIIVIKNGRVVEKGTYEELLNNKGYFYYMGEQFEN